MTVAFDAFSTSGIVTGANSTDAPLSVSHVPVSTPRGVKAYITQSGTGGNSDDVTAVTYGGVAMARVATAADVLGEAMRTYAYFLGASIPTGTQSCAVTYSGGTLARILYVLTATAAADTEVEASGIAEADQADPTIALSTGAGVNCFVSGALSSGLTTHTNLLPGTGYTQLDLTDVVSRASQCERRTSNSTGGTVNVLWDTGAVSDDTAGIGVAIKESAAAGLSIPVAMGQYRRLRAQA